MLILSWNCRGLGNAPTVRTLSSFLKSTRPSILFLSETLSSLNHSSPTLQSLGFPNLFTVPAINRSGGLCLGWDDSISASISFSCQNLILLHILPTITSPEWKQRSRCQWIKSGDKNTKYFHVTASNRKRRNSIRALQLEDGSWTTDHSKISSRIISHFKSIFKEEPCQQMENSFSISDSPITQDENDALSSTPSCEEIEKAIRGMGPLKAPGPDGLPAIFYQQGWEIVGSSLITTIQQFFRTTSLPININHTNLVLIPKIDNPATPADYRPISLCNVSYKTISKILTNRLRPLLNKIISPTQNAFVPGRHINDNVIVAQELLHSMKLSSNNQQSFALKIDLSKAYDRLSWPFIRHTLHGVGIQGHSNDLIMKCVTSSSFSILLNGSPEGWFQAGRGIRQGCPLSPFIFIICTEVLSRLFYCHERDDLFTGLRINRYCPSISHLLFADDLLIFGKASEEVLQNAYNILDTFASWSGQKINYDKSSIHFSKSVCTRVQRRLASLLQQDPSSGN